jgi:hypothetical protein
MPQQVADFMQGFALIYFLNHERKTTMTPIEIVGQTVGIFAMACNILSYQQKKQSHLIFCQLLGGALFSVSFFMLGATMGGLLNVVATLRAILFLFEEKLHTSHPLWLGGFIACYVVFYVLSFTVFGVAPTPINFLIEILPVIGMTALSVAFMRKDSRRTRQLSLISSPAWLIYNIYYVSVGAIVCEAISLVSIFVGMLRHDIHKKEDAAKK